MKKLILITLSASLFLFGCAGNEAENESPMQDITPQAVQEDIDLDSFQKDIDQVNQAKSVSDCEKIQDSNSKNLCLNVQYLAEAVSTKNPATCDKITDESLVENCKFNITE